MLKQISAKLDQSVKSPHHHVSAIISIKLESLHMFSETKFIEMVQHST